MATTKPTKPENQLSVNFGGEKENFNASLIETGFEPDVPQILGGANLNYMLDAIGQGLDYNNTVSDFICSIPVAKTLTVNSNNKLDYIQYAVEVYDSNKSYNLGDWVVGYVNDIKRIYQSLINGNQGNALSNTNSWEEVRMRLAGVDSGTFRNLGEIVFSVTPIDDETLHLLDGSVIEAEDIPEDFQEYLLWLLEEYPNCFVNESTWQEQVSTYGECGKFVYGGEDSSVRLPKITGIVQGTNTVNDLGKIIEAGLPSISHVHTRGTMNITGSFINNDYASPSGAMYVSNTHYVPASGGIAGHPGTHAGNYYTISLDASRNWTGSTSNNSSVSEVYGNSETVQPQVIQGYYYITYTNLGSKNRYVDGLNNVIENINELQQKLQTDEQNLQERIDSLGNVYTFKGSVATYADLPGDDNVIGDVYDVKSEGKNYAWIGISEDFEDGWDDIGGDWSNYYKKDEVDSLISTLSADISALTARVAALEELINSGGA